MTHVNPIVEGSADDHIALVPRWRSVCRLRCERLALAALGGEVCTPCARPLERERWPTRAGS